MKLPRYAIWSAFLVLLLLIILIFHYEQKYQELSLHQVEVSARLEARIEKLNVDFADLDKRFSQTLRVLADAVSKDKPEPQTSAPAAKFDPQQLKPGLYVVEDEVRLQNIRRDGEFKEKFTIYHINAPLAGSKEWILNVGLAISGVTTSPQFYIDYDGDGQIDMSMMYEFVSFVPFGNILAKSLSERNSQRVYDTFLRRVPLARYSSPTELQAEGGSYAAALWKFVDENGGSMLRWLTAHGKSVAE